MIRKKLSILLVLLLALSTSGCWDARDINDRDILTAVIVDKTDYGYAFYNEVPVITGGGEGTSSVESKKQPMILRSEGRTLAEARLEAERQLDKPVFLGAVQTVLVTDKMASYGIEGYLLRLRQIQDYRKTVHVAVVSGDPQKILEDISEHSPSAGFAIYDTIESLISEGHMYKITVANLLDRMASNYKHFVLSDFALINNELKFIGLSVFSGGMKTGFIPASETNSIVYMRGVNPKFHYTVPYNDTYADIEIRLVNKKVRPHDENGKISFDLELKFKAILMFPEKDKPVTDEEMAVIGATMKAMLEQEFSSMLVKSQQVYHDDVYDLFEKFQNEYPEEYAKMNWQEEYEKASFNLSIDFKLSPTDLIDYKPK